MKKKSLNFSKVYEAEKKDFENEFENTQSKSQLQLSDHSCIKKLEKKAHHNVFTMSFLYK